MQHSFNEPNNSICQTQNAFSNHHDGLKMLLLILEVIPFYSIKFHCVFMETNFVADIFVSEQ